MPDLLTDDETRALFAQLRTTELPRVVGPGSSAAHRTVRRRRGAAAAVAAGFAVIAVAGAAAWLGSDPAPGPDPAGPSPSHAVKLGPEVEPTLDSDRLLALAEVARAALPSPPGPSQYVAMGSWGGVEVGDHMSTFGLPDRGMEPGRYRIDVACVGIGRLTLVADALDTVTSVEVACGATADPRHTFLDVTRSAPVSIRIEPDADAEQRAGYAYALVRR